MKLVSRGAQRIWRRACGWNIRMVNPASNFCIVSAANNATFPTCSYQLQLSRGVAGLSRPFDSSPKRLVHSSHPRLGIVNFKLADIGEGIAEVELLKWHKQAGEHLEEMAAVCEVQSDKAAVEITSRYTGTIKELKHKVGDIVKIGEVLLSMEVEGEGAEVSEGAHEEKPDIAQPATHEIKSGGAPATSQRAAGEAIAVPAARRLAKELGIDISLVRGSGKGGRISKEDVEHFAKISASSSTPAPQASGQSQQPPQAAFPAGTPPARPSRENRTVQLRGFSRAMVKSMTETAKVPHLNIGDEFDVSALLSMRDEMKATVEKEHKMKLTVTPLIVKAVSLALEKHPILNSKLDNESQYTIYGSHNISMAIDTPNGLVVPNIKNVQDLTILEVQSELLRLQHLAMSNKLSASDLTGGTVSVSNVGVIGGTYVKALLFDNQAMIIGLGRTQTVPKFDKNGQVVPRQVLHCGFSADHRHCDGATVARFAAELKKLLESPGFMLLYMT